MVETTEVGGGEAGTGTGGPEGSPAPDVEYGASDAAEEVDG